MPRLDVRGAIVPNDYKAFYDFWGEDSTCPSDAQKVLNETLDGEVLDVYINSPGGVIDVGSEIYTMLREASGRCDVKIHITGQACSAASIIAMAGWSEMSPTALMMIHCVSTYAGGNHSDFEHVAEMLQTADNALCSAYVAKTGMSTEDALNMMEKETWLHAADAKELGLIDSIMFEDSEPEFMTNAVGFKLPSQEQMAQVKQLMEAKVPEADPETPDRTAEMQAKINLLNLSARRINA